MARVRVEETYQAKKLEITKQAVSLLGEIGFADFSINKVIKRAGITKGAFFHYFASRDELIDGIVRLLLEPLMDAVGRIAMDQTISPKEKIFRMFETSFKLKATDTRETQQLIMLMNKEENKVMLQLMTAGMVECCTSLYEKVFREGNQAGQFHIPHPHGSAFLFMQMIVAINIEIGRVLYRKNVDAHKRQALQSKLDAFAVYSAQLLSLNKDERLYTDDMLRVNLL